MQLQVLGEQSEKGQAAAEMGKSIRSKIKKKFRTIKRNIVDPFYTEKQAICLEDAPLPVRPEETPESFAWRNDPRKKDPRLASRCTAPAGERGDRCEEGSFEWNISRTIAAIC